MTSSLYEARNAPKQMIMNFSRRITGLKGLQRNNNAKVLVKGVFFVLSCVIGLPDSSVDVVIASQSFHWFANTSALQEINRVLVPGGMFGIFSVMPDYSVPWMAELWEFQAPLYKEKSIVLPFEEG